MAPASIIVRLTESLVAGFNTYCFKADGKTPDVIEDILKGDCGYDGKEFFVGGEIVKRGLPDDKKKSLAGKGVTLMNCPREAAQGRVRQGAGGLTMMYLYVQAPFAACRTFTAGWYRPTATFLTPSAAYGLVLNIAQIESRLREEDENHDSKVPASLTRSGLPPVRLAVGALAADGREPYPRVHTVYQQLHNYMVGGKEKVDDPENPGQKVTKEALGLRRTKHAKWNVTPVRREFLSELCAVVALDGKPDLEDRVRRGLHGELNAGRYGLPFLGDNAFLLDRLEELPSAPPAHWYERVTEASAAGPRPGTTRLTILIDRADLPRTTSALFAPQETPTREIPDAAWTEIRPPAEPSPQPRRK